MLLCKRRFGTQSLVEFYWFDLFCESIKSFFKLFSVFYWQINFSRFHQDFRDAIMVGATERKLGASAAECFKYILVQMYERTDPWQRVSIFIK